jgi:hypothetical protein
VKSPSSMRLFKAMVVAPETIAHELFRLIVGCFVSATHGCPKRWSDVIGGWAVRGLPVIAYAAVATSARLGG